MKFLVPILTLAFSYSTVFAEEKDKSIFIYIHPGSLISSIIAAGVESYPVFFYVTTEFLISKSVSVIVQPSFVKGKFSQFNSDDIRTYFRVGSGIGIRKYLLSIMRDPNCHTNEPGLFYLQLSSNAHYRNADKNNPGFLMDGLAHLGVTLSRIFKIDTGVGYKFKGTDWAGSATNRGDSFTMDINLSMLLPL